MRRGARALVLSSALALLALVPSPAGAKQTHLLKEVFPPTFNQSNSLAVDQTANRLLVLDSGAKTISRWNFDGTAANFSALGTNVIDAQGAGDGTPENGFSFGNFAGEEQIAIDNSGTASDGDIYVTQTKFDGTLHLIDVFASTGAYLGQLTGTGATAFNSNSRPCGVAVDPAGSAYVADRLESKTYKYTSQGAPHNPLVNNDFVAPAFTGVTGPCSLAAGAGPSNGFLFVNRFFGFAGNSVVRLNSASGAVEGVVDPGEDRLVAVDPTSGHLYAASSFEEGNLVREYEAAGTLPGQQASGFFGGLATIKGIAVSGTSHDVYVASDNKVSVYGPKVTVPEPVTDPAELTGATSARLKGTVDPDGQALTECLFEYGLTSSYGQVAPCEAPNAAEVGAGHGPVAVHADVSGLEGEKLYHFRLVAKNANAALYPLDSNGTSKGADVTLTTPSKPAIKAEWTAGVGLDEATVEATINPGNAETSYRVQYGTTNAYGQETATEVVAAGMDADDHTVSATLPGLTPGTEYHFRFFAENGIGQTSGGDREFRTFAAGPAGLPDLRAYELVSPVDKEGAEAGVPASVVEAGGLAASVQPRQASPSGEAVTYGSFTAFGADPESAPATSQYLSTRHAGAGRRTTSTPASKKASCATPSPASHPTSPRRRRWSSNRS